VRARTSRARTAFTRREALEYCEGLGFAGHNDWRLPNVRELESIVHYGRFDPAISSMFDVVSEGYWSSSSDVDISDYAWYVFFYHGDVTIFDKLDHFFVRAVRNAP
jgi:hypothetical protein